MTLYIIELPSNQNALKRQNLLTLFLIFSFQLFLLIEIQPVAAIAQQGFHKIKLFPKK